MGSTSGTGGRAFLYASYKKRNDNELTSTFDDTRFKTNKIDFRNTQTNFVKGWNHFDSNINNAIIE